MKVSNQRGFTLVEILIIIAVTGTLLALMVGSYTNFFFSSIIDGEIDSLVSMLRLAKSRSMAEVNDLAHQVVIGTNTFRLETQGGATVIETHRLNTQAIVTSGAMTIVFNKITGTTPSCPTSCTITIGNNPSTSESKSVVITNQGVITVQ